MNEEAFLNGVGVDGRLPEYRTGLGDAERAKVRCRGKEKDIDLMRCKIEVEMRRKEGEPDSWSKGIVGVAKARRKGWAHSCGDGSSDKDRDPFLDSPL